MTDFAATQRFEAFSGQHWALLGVFVIGVAVVAGWGRSLRSSSSRRIASRRYAAILTLVIMTMQVYYVVEPGGLDIGASLPLELCDLAEYVAVIALWTRSPRATAFVYYVALTLSIQAILTPSLELSFPSPRFFGFWILHFLVVWAAVYLTWGTGFRPTWRLYRFTCAVTLVWAAVAYSFNLVLSTNFGYLNHKPSSASLLDLLGPWPWYLLVGGSIIALVWALVLTLPWELRRARPNRHPASTRPI
ncbi:MAG TPA: TIGR02206 family membrane protein [Marmoricola sp.]|nr:TIGR02206 family membrane protein [Marmoricola sp.]